MTTFQLLAVRDESAGTLNPTMINLLIALMVLILVGLCAIGLLFWLRSVRRARKESELPLYNEKSNSKSSNHRRLTITVQEKQNLIDNSSSPPPSPVPEIRITFPDEVDETGKKQSGRVVVVRVGDHSVGLEPLNEDLPPYQKDSSDRFQSLDLDRIGGLKENDEKRWS
ncbi:uncharacterized protein BDZ99DRAFT_282932 [Mytilinidion resinicola]|uniref:Uncharacterized protein n=1 Tax=Mytilinidion resinicola TaxID=574789 RepID=A0A6A6YVB1_9PEZI|nr:uncharacterized protein BDZ99DRAFT_282932 [Mytilinidion resinicola]KAF2811915.1 hypothetical protein BDZ99DRAFT_282932 [Mytilinidion resinicola]